MTIAALGTFSWGCRKEKMLLQRLAPLVKTIAMREAWLHDRRMALLREEGSDPRKKMDLSQCNAGGFQKLG